MEAVKKPEEKIELDPNEWMNWNDDKFNEWRRSHDFPRIVEFLYDSLPSFGDWLSEQDGLSQDDLLFHGPARFVRYYGQRINYVEHDISISVFSNSPVPPAICYEFIQSDELETRLTKTKCIKRVEFLSYIDWAIYKKVTNIENIISFLTPGGRTSQDRHYLNSHSNIQFNIPLHMPNRSVNSPFWVNNTAPPKLELL
ncbi:hypothetical protein, partial [Vibrio crassostreae]|uniref:hypothetical protein n=1 Tax=Vibrio crassostreae TaxID=246167 RepID=UPI000372FE5D